MNYDKSAGRRIVAKAYETGMAAQDNPSFIDQKEKAFFRALNEDSLSKVKVILTKHPDRAELLKEAFASLSMEDVKWANNIVQAAWRVNTRKEFDDMLSQLAQPKGGTENLTNVATPGQPPGKVSAVPGHAGDYDKTGSTLTGKYPQAYQNPRAPGHGIVDPYGKQPQPKVNDDKTDYPRYGEVGEAGGTSSIPTYDTSITPGKSQPGRYRGTVPTPRVPAKSYAGVEFVKALQGGDEPMIESGGRDSSLYKTIEKNTFTVTETTPNKPNSHFSEIAPIKNDWVAKALKETLKEEDIAGSREGEVLSGEGRQSEYTPDGASPTDDTSTGDQEDYGTEFDAIDDDLALNEEAKARRAKNLALRFLKQPTAGSPPGTSFSQPIQITGEERAEEDDELASLASKYEEEADELARDGFNQAATVRREKAMNLRKRMNAKSRSTSKWISDIMTYGKIQKE